MVEKNVAYNRDNREQEFADNDPLAQLARLVGQEDRPSHVAPPAAQQPVERREPEFNLEDELLREFAIYDSPRYEPVALDAANDVRSPVPAGEFMQRVESVFARKEPELEPVEQYAPADAEEYLVAEHAASSDLRDDFSDDPDSVAALFDVAHRLTANHPDMQHEPVAVHEEPAAYVEPEAYVEPVAAAEVSQEVSYQEPVSPAPVLETPVQPQNDASASHQPDWELMAETSGEAAIDLASELEMSVAEELPAPVPASPPLARRSSLDYSSLRLPLANFGAPRATPVTPKPVEPVAPVAQFTQPLEAPANHVEPAIPAGQKMSAMDELIYDVAKYEISSRDVIAAMPAARLEPVVAVVPPVAVAPTPVTPAHVVPTPARTEPSFQQPAAKEEPDLGEFDAFKDDDFELALDDIDFDIDLSEIANIDVPVTPVEKPVAAAPPAPVAQAPVAPKPVVAAPAPAPVATPVAAAAVTARPQQVVAATAAAAAAPRQEAPRPAPVVAAPPATLESLPFDPSQIGETEDQPETITEMEVPELPVGVFEPKPAPRRQEEDLDLDTELASLFAPAVTGGLDRNKNAAAPRQPQPTQDEVDEFERALEQDFRRSMQEAAETRASGGERHAPADIHEPVRYSDEERGGVRRWLVPVAAVLGVVLVGGGTYALMFGGSAGQGSNGAPVIIAADSEPTKVVPENPGGRVVPNQDKAVYDRVAGSAPADPKQPSLISTNEQPVDVVQRTLIPEQLPLEGENEEMEAASSTPVGETEDPRLLSPDEKAQAAENQGGSPVNVSPRKVRTMIVKPDGTLVAQEVAAPATPAPQADKVEELAAPQATAAAERAPAVISASRVPVTPEQPAQPQAQTPAPAATAPKPAQTAAPLPGSRPSAQPANVVATVSNQGNVRPAPPSQPAQETAAAPTPTTNASSTGGYYVQVASLPSQAEAQKSYQNLSTKFASVIGGRGVDIKAAEIAGKGTFYRVRIPAGDKNEAAALCERFRSAGGSCLIAR